jgi:hypothetical protein
MLLINIFAIAIGNFAAGRASDALRLAGESTPLTHVLLVTEAMGSPMLYWCT